MSCICGTAWIIWTHSSNSSGRNFAPIHRTSSTGSVSCLPVTTVLIHWQDQMTVTDLIANKKTLGKFVTQSGASLIHTVDESYSCVYYTILHAANVGLKCCHAHTGKSHWYNNTYLYSHPHRVAFVKENFTIRLFIFVLIQLTFLRLCGLSFHSVWLIFPGAVRAKKCFIFCR